MAVKRRIAIASGNHLCSNPRVLKEADALAAAGFDVHVLGGAYQADLKARDRALAAGRPWFYQPAYDLTTNPVRRLWLKTQKRMGGLLWTKLRCANAWQIYYGTSAMARAIEKIDADLTIAHWEAALPGTVQRFARGGRVGVDMEDWFSEDLLPVARAGRPISLLADYEQRLLRHGLHSSCTSEAMADALVTRYGCRRPVVIRNVFPAKEREAVVGDWNDRAGMQRLCARNVPANTRPSGAPVSIHWYSQTIGPGRGLEELFAAAQNLDGDYEIHLRGGKGGYEQWLQGQMSPNIEPKVYIHDPVTNADLLSRISEHDIGYCGEPNNPPNKDLTISNKFFQYLQGGLAIVASDTTGQKEAASETPGAVSLVKAGNVQDLRAALQALIDDHARLTAMRVAAWDAGSRLCWENEAPRLVESVERAVER